MPKKVFKHSTLVIDHMVSHQRERQRKLGDRECNNDLGVGEYSFSFLELIVNKGFLPCIGNLSTEGFTSKCLHKY